MLGLGFNARLNVGKNKGSSKSGKEQQMQQVVGGGGGGGGDALCDRGRLVVSGVDVVMQNRQRVVVMSLPPRRNRPKLRG